MNKRKKQTEPKSTGQVAFELFFGTVGVLGLALILIVFGSIYQQFGFTGLLVFGVPSILGATLMMALCQALISSTRPATLAI